MAFPDNAWDIGYPSGGNYWSDYNGSDLLSGPYQNETGGDGIGDTPYVIDVNNMDKYPLMEPWSPIATVVIHIRANGSIDPADAPIQREGDNYTLTEDIHGSIVVERDNVVVDGAGYALRGPGAFDSKGIFLSQIKQRDDKKPGNQSVLHRNRNFWLFKQRAIQK